MSGNPRPVALYLLASAATLGPCLYFLTAASCHEGRTQRLLKPPEAMPAAVSGGANPPPDVPPTAVMYGELAGNCGTNLPFLHKWLSPAAPLSPDAKSKEIPRAPAFMNSAL